MPDFDQFNGDFRAAPSIRSRQTIEPPATLTLVIIGAGPGGLFAACELLRHGVKPTLWSTGSRRIARRVAPFSSRRHWRCLSEVA